MSWPLLNNHSRSVSRLPRRGHPGWLNTSHLDQFCQKKQLLSFINSLSHPFAVLWPSLSLINSPVLPSYSSAEEQGCYLSISSYWSPERAQSAGNQDPQTVLWRNRRELDNRIRDEGNDPFKKQLDAKRWASQIATVPFVFPPPLISVQRQPGPNDKDHRGVISYRY